MIMIAQDIWRKKIFNKPIDEGSYKILKLSETLIMII